MIKYFDKYQYLILRINEINDSKIFQQLLFDNSFTWSGIKKFYADRNCIYLVFYNEGNNKGGLSISTATDLIKYYDGKYNGNIYNINDYNLVKNILIYGTDIPNYKPKRTKREI